MSLLVRARDLTRRFGDLTAVDSISLDLASGEVVGLLGANGAGKTTFIRMLLGLLAPTSGSIELDGLPASKADRSELGYVPQGLGLYADLTVAENVAFAANAHRVDVPELDDELSSVADQRIDAISLGLRRRVAFVTARCHDPRVLVLDEPTSGVGPLGRAALWDTIHDAAEGGTGVLVSTHYMEEAEECDRVVMLARGRQVAAGPVDDIIGGRTTVRIPGDTRPEQLDELRRRGATVLSDPHGWRVVGLDRSAVRDLVPDAETVAATFEEAFVELST